MQSSLANKVKRIEILKLYKGLIRQTRIDPNAAQAKASALYTQTNMNEMRDFLREEFRQNYLSDAKYCAAKDQMVFLGNAYLTYLRSTSETLQLYSRYCKGERSIEESANIVGLALPKLYQDPLSPSPSPSPQSSKSDK